uniref:SHSP domain-containing protein n=1 Tax=Acrobeloides nanus TaxID=290746 RepID=A0A914BZT6_9BILA
MTTIEVQHNWEGEEWDWPFQHNDGIVKVHNGPERFEVGLEASYFRPNEIQVNIVDHTLMVRCKHESRYDQHGVVAREISRNYHLPDDVETTSFKCHLDKKGILRIFANKKH